MVVNKLCFWMNNNNSVAFVCSLAISNAHAQLNFPYCCLHLKPLLFDLHLDSIKLLEWPPPKADGPPHRTPRKIHSHDTILARAGGLSALALLCFCLIVYILPFFRNTTFLPRIK